MSLIQILLLLLYAISASFIFFYSVVQLHLVILYVRAKRKKDIHFRPEKRDPEWRKVTVQLPVYNEIYVVERLLDAVAKLDYPKDKLEIQVLDDSDDETVDVVSRKVGQLLKEGIDIKQIRRDHRTGFKAGALSEGLKTATGDFIAIFDADFVPSPDFLKKTMPQFEDSSIGMVQTRWDHINKNYSLLTRLQAFGLNAHFSVEQLGRNVGKYFINFNGTAGVWRKESIIDAGGWQSDTLTEDLDLSYRAQLKGWKFKYLEDVSSPAELPAAIYALKTQQYRWTKGAAETTRKILWSLFRAKIPLTSKIHGAFHLMNSTVFVCILITALLSIPIMFIISQSPESSYFKLAPLMLISLLFISIFYMTSLYHEKKNALSTLISFFLTFPLFLSISMGLSLHNATAVIGGYIGYKTPFHRTPKFKIEHTNDKWFNKRYISRNIGYLALLEGLLALYFLTGIFLGIKLEIYGLLPFHLLLFFGFGIVFCYSILHSRTPPPVVK